MNYGIVVAIVVVEAVVDIVVVVGIVVVAAVVVVVVVVAVVFVVLEVNLLFPFHERNHQSQIERKIYEVKLLIMLIAEVMKMMFLLIDDSTEKLLQVN